MQIDGLRQETVAVTGRNASLEDRVGTADTDMTAAKSDFAAEVQKTHEASACEFDRRYVIDKLDRESGVVVKQGEDFRHALVTVRNEKQAMENKTPNLPLIWTRRERELASMGNSCLSVKTLKQNTTHCSQRFRWV
jgi:hypothetical protein